jgi:uncharacterized protein with NRDE domain
MCLVLFGFKTTPSFPIILAANRDEFYKRPTAPMDFWQEDPTILAGRDLECGGTWFGINTRGRFAALTNYRDLHKGKRIEQGAPSRGEIIVNFLKFNGSIKGFLETLKPDSSAYNGFNLLLGDCSSLYSFSNQNQKYSLVLPGIHGLSNYFLDTPWPKVTRGKIALEKAVDTDRLNPDALFDLLSDSSVPEDADLPDTGVGLEWERLLSPLFIKSPSYGTRSSIFMGITPKGQIKVTERTYFPDKPTPHKDRSFSLFPSLG